jgi:pyruvate, water dikinase
VKSALTRTLCTVHACTLALLSTLAGCSGNEAPVAEVCTLEGPADFAERIGCLADFDVLASVPLDQQIPGARSVKVVLDQLDGDALYFQNSTKYKIHYDFVKAELGGADKPPVPQKGEFDSVQYASADRRFILGAVTYYEDPKLWVLELAPYDNASSEMISKLLRALRKRTYFGNALAFHPTSVQQEQSAAALAKDQRVVTNEDIYADISYQPLTLGEAMGKLRFVRADALAASYVSFRDIVVLDKVPNDITVVSGIVTEEFQTPLSHVNVLSQNRKTPNMGLRGAFSNATLKALEGKWVKLNTAAGTWTVTEVSEAEADAYWQNKQPKVQLPAIDLTVTGLPNIEAIVDESQGDLREAIKRAVLAYGGKSAQYAVLYNTKGLPVRKAFAIPIYYYDQFMRENGFYPRLEALLADAAFKDSAQVRDQALKALRDEMGEAPVNAAFQELLRQKLAADYPGQSMRFRSSTNSEDLDGFPCAGCYESHTGDAEDWDDTLDAIRDTWATVWLFRTFEERSYYGIDHFSVGMGLLVHHNFPDEEANGVALTANPFDPEGLDQPAFYVNVQTGGQAEVVHPPPGVTSDEYLYYYSAPGYPQTYLSQSNLVDAGGHVLTPRQAFDLGNTLKLIHERFSAAYGPKSGNQGWYAMDVEFKFDDEGSDTGPRLYIKQARPHPGRGLSVETD